MDAKVQGASENEPKYAFHSSTSNIPRMTAPVCDADMLLSTQRGNAAMSVSDMLTSIA